MLACLLMAGPTSAAEMGVLPLYIAATVRVHRYWRSWLQLVTQPVFLTILAYFAWSLLSRIWAASPPGDFRDELGMARWILLMLALWPVSDRRSLLLAALAVGFALAQLAQLAHALGLAFHIPALTFDRFPGRNSGWWDPVVGGSLLTAILGLHLPAALWGRHHFRVLGILGSSITILGILATGTRGAYLASSALIIIALIHALARRFHTTTSPDSHDPLAAYTEVLANPTHRKRTGYAMVLWLVGGVMILVAVLSLRSTIIQRTHAAIDDITAAIKHQDYTTDTGARIQLNRWAIEALAAHPLLGTGAGTYQSWCLRHTIEQGIDPNTRNFHAHAHNALLHIAATLGMPGLLMALAFIVLALRGAFRTQPGDGPPGYAQGPAYALLGLLLVSAFDTIQVNSQTAGLLSVLVIFSLQQRPAPFPWKRTYPLAS